MLLPRACLFRLGDTGTIIHPHVIAGWLEKVFVEGDPYTQRTGRNVEGRGCGMSSVTVWDTEISREDL